MISNIKRARHFYSLPLNTTSNNSSKVTMVTITKSNNPELAVRTGELWKATVIQYKRNYEMTSKSSDLSTASSYASTSDDSDASSLVSLVCSKVEGLTKDLASPPIPREVVFHPENSSLFHPNYQAEAEFSMDVDIGPEDAPRDVPRGKSICHSL